MSKLVELLRAAVPAQRTHPGAQRSRSGREVLITIVGESGYQDHIAHVSEQYGGQLPIVLEAEPDNPDDPLAVAVLVDGGVVGYLDRGLAPLWQPTVAAAAAHGAQVTGRASVHVDGDGCLGVYGRAVWSGSGEIPRRNDLIGLQD